MRSTGRSFQPGFVLHTGGGTCGYGADTSTLDRFARYWYNIMRRDVWWSKGQGGYYFSNRHGCFNCFQAPTHTHIYQITDLDDDKDGQKLVGWATKVQNVRREKGTTVLRYTDIATWLTDMNERIGTSNEC
jgi:hypothetical protein